VTVAQGDVWWADLSEARGSEPGFRRPVIVIQGDALNRSRIATVVWGTLPSATGLPKESVANVSQLVTLDKTDLTERTGKLPRSKLELVLSGVDVVLGR
jgi:mRNA interferase MazF